jgi:hypothetical protein
MCRCATGQAIVLIILTSRKTGLLPKGRLQGLPPGQQQGLQVAEVREKDNPLLFYKNLNRRGFINCGNFI